MDPLLTTVPPAAGFLPPRLAKTFNLLRSGRHLHGSDPTEAGMCYADVVAHESSYRQLLGAFGYTLVTVPFHGFLYATSDDGVVNENILAGLLLMAAFFTQVGAQLSVEDVMGMTWDITDVDQRCGDVFQKHAINAGYLKALASDDGTRVQAMVKALTPLESIDFIQWVDRNQRFRFRPAAHRMIDAIETVGAQVAQAPA